jgi:hypothetical protein
VIGRKAARPHGRLYVVGDVDHQWEQPPSRRGSPKSWGLSAGELRERLRDEIQRRLREQAAQHSRANKQLDARVSGPLARGAPLAVAAVGG